MLGLNPSTDDNLSTIRNSENHNGSEKPVDLDACLQNTNANITGRYLIRTLLHNFENDFGTYL